MVILFPWSGGWAEEIIPTHPFCIASQPDGSGPRPAFLCLPLTIQFLRACVFDLASLGGVCAMRGGILRGMEWHIR